MSTVTDEEELLCWLQGGQVARKFFEVGIYAPYGPAPMLRCLNNFKIYIIHLKQRYPFSKIQLTKSKTKNIKNDNPSNLIFQGVVLEGA